MNVVKISFGIELAHFVDVSAVYQEIFVTDSYIWFFNTIIIGCGWKVTWKWDPVSALTSSVKI